MGSKCGFCGVKVGESVVQVGQKCGGSGFWGGKSGVWKRFSWGGDGVPDAPNAINTGFLHRKRRTAASSGAQKYAKTCGSARSGAQKCAKKARQCVRRRAEVCKSVREGFPKRVLLGGGKIVIEAVR